MALSRGEESPMPLNAKEKCWAPMRGHDVHVASKLQRVSVEWMDALKCHEIYRCISALEVNWTSRVADASPRFLDLLEAHFQSRSLTFSRIGRVSARKIYEKENETREILDREVVIRKTRTSSSRPSLWSSLFSSLSSQICALFPICRVSSPLCIYISWTVI